MQGLGAPYNPLDTFAKASQTMQNMRMGDQQEADINAKREQQEKMKELAGRYSQGDYNAIPEMFNQNPELALQFKKDNDKRISEVGEAKNNKIRNATVIFLARLKDAPKEEWPAMAQEALNNDLIDIEGERAKAISEGNEFVVDAGLVGYMGADNYKQLMESKKNKIKHEQGTGIMQGYSFNPETGQYDVSEEIRQRVDDAVSKADSIDAKTRQSINKDLTMLTQDTKIIYNTANDLEKLSKINSGPAAIAMVFKFMKALDPTSVVREGEFMTAENSAGIPEKLRNYYNKISTGDSLGDVQTADFVSTAKELANSAISNSTAEVDKYLNTFESTLPKSFVESLKGRIPQQFEIKNKDEIAPKFTINQTATNAQGQKIKWDGSAWVPA